MAQPWLSSAETSEDSEEQESRTWWQLWWPPVALGPAGLGAGCPHGGRGVTPVARRVRGRHRAGGQRPRGVSLQSQTKTTGTSDNPPKGVCCAGSINHQANPSQTSEHQCHVTLSFIPPVPSHHPGSCPTSTCPTLEAQRWNVPSMSPPALLPPPGGGHGTPKPEGTQGRFCQVVLVAATLDERAEEQRPPPVGRGTRALQGHHWDSRVG